MKALFYLNDRMCIAGYYITLWVLYKPIYNHWRSLQKPGNTLGLLGRLNQSSETLQTPARKTVEWSNITSFNRRGPRRPRLISFSKQLYGWSISIPRALAGPDSNLPQFSSSHPYFFQQNVNFSSAVPSLLPLSPKQNPHFLPNPQCECPGDFMIASHSH